VLKLLGIFTVVLLVNACTQAKFALVNAPAITFEGSIVENIDYGELDRQQLDIYIPKELKKSYPVVVFFHGGRWTNGDKQQYKFVGMSLAEQGYIAVLPNTRLYPEVKFPVFAQDAAQALGWVFNNINQYKGNSNLFVSGHSSGAHLGALIIADKTFLAKHELKPSIVNAFAGISGPYDFVPEAADIKDMFGPPNNFPNLVVTNFVEGDEPPMLLLYTDEDKSVHPRNLKAIKQGIEKVGGDVTSIIYPKGDHAAPVAAFSWANPSDLPVPQDIDVFFKKHMRI